MKLVRIVLSMALVSAGFAFAQGAAAKPISAAELKAQLSGGSPQVLLVDVRTAEEFRGGRIPGAVLFPYDSIEPRKAEFRKLAGDADRKIVVYCRSGRRSAIAARTLVALGYTDVSDFGGIGNWSGPFER